VFTLSGVFSLVSLTSHMNYQFESLADHLDLVATIAQWHWDEWGHADPTGSLEAWTTGLATRTLRDTIPTSYVALVEHMPVGSVTLVDHDMTTHQELSPWLAGLYILPAYRHQGIGSALPLLTYILPHRSLPFTIKILHS
jgi:hypothetical protein